MDRRFEDGNGYVSRETLSFTDTKSGKYSIENVGVDRRTKQAFEMVYGLAKFHRHDVVAPVCNAVAGAFESVPGGGQLAMVPVDEDNSSVG